MIVLKTNTSPQSLSIIPRLYDTTIYLKVTDDSTNVTVDYKVQGATISGDYLDFQNAFNLVEGHFYSLVIGVDLDGADVWNDILNLWQLDADYWNEGGIDADTIIYKDRIFCTDQEINENNNQYYRLDKGQFETYNGNDNTYIVI